MPCGALKSPLGWLQLTWDEQGLHGLEFAVTRPVANAAVPSALAEPIHAYFAGNPDALDAASGLLQERGTPFQRRVWQRLREIPPGQRRTYGELARELHTSPRAVGNACRANPLPLFTPCHRVVASNGLGGFSGAREGRWLELKAALLEHEARWRLQTRK
jgi:methylated-DNA-[protein]-cysteine S-methyltransferase